MSILAHKIDERIDNVEIKDNLLTVYLKDGRMVSVPLNWYPRLLHANSKARNHWEICGGGYGIHWPDIDEDLSIDGILKGTSALRGRASNDRN